MSLGHDQLILVNKVVDEKDQLEKGLGTKSTSSK
jgi:hypothetical protein